MGVGAGLYMHDVVVKKVHVRYLISWWVLVALWCGCRQLSGLWTTVYIEFKMYIGTGSFGQKQ